MIMGMTTFVFVHVVLSLIGILSGILVVFGMLGAKRMNGMTAVFLTTTVLTSVSGFLLPAHKLLPSHILGILSLIVLAIAIFGRYGKHLARGWSRTYAVMAVIALYFNVFVLVVQLFLKVPSIHALAPTQTEPPFKIAQGVVLLLFIILAVLAAKRFRSDLVRGA
jgi:hypothetical protein